MAVAESTLGAFYCGMIESFGVIREKHNMITSSQTREQCASTEPLPSTSPSASADLHAHYPLETNKFEINSHHVSYKLMPVWSCLLYNPKLWKLMRKTLRGNLLVAIISFWSILLSQQHMWRQQSHPFSSSAAVFTNNVINQTKIANGKVSNYNINNNSSSRYGDNFSNRYNSNAGLHNSYFYTGLHENGIRLDASNVTRVTNTVMHAHSDSRLFAMIYLVSVYWCNLFLWILHFAVTYGGQWPLYVIIQVVSLVWYAQLYTEVWLLRKGFILHDKRDANKQYQVQHLSNEISSVNINKAINLENEIKMTEHGAGQSYSWFALAVIAVLRKWCIFAISLLRYKKPQSPPSMWIIGDNKAAQEATLVVLSAKKYKNVACAENLPNSHVAPTTDKRLFGLTEEKKQSSDNNESHLQHVNKTDWLQKPISRKSYVQETLEVISENIFKFIATFLFAYAAQFVEWLVPYCYIGKAINFVMNTFLYTFYVFSYRYSTQRTENGQRISLRAQLAHFERCWSYNLGFGCITTLMSFMLTAYFNTVVSMCFMCTVYAWHVMCSGYATPLISSPLPLRQSEEKSTLRRRFTLHRLMLFTPWFTLLDQVQLHFKEVWRLLVIIFLSYIFLLSLKYFAQLL